MPTPYASSSKLADSGYPDVVAHTAEMLVRDDERDGYRSDIDDVSVGQSQSRGTAACTADFSGCIKSTVDRRCNSNVQLSILRHARRDGKPLSNDTSLGRLSRVRIQKWCYRHQVWNVALKGSSSSIRPNHGTNDKAALYRHGYGTGGEMGEITRCTPKF
ncbi:hypothetical protein GY45DRAFT_657018 [Cubamyces sp. BRFM 1775]|nr:hypothetical protein GY45DRAFT_657018 [Cubamyces sp. BRFM 1775]